MNLPESAYVNEIEFFTAHIFSLRMPKLHTAHLHVGLSFSVQFKALAFEKVTHPVLSIHYTLKPSCVRGIFIQVANCAFI